MGKRKFPEVYRPYFTPYIYSKNDQINMECVPYLTNSCHKTFFPSSPFLDM